MSRKSLTDEICFFFLKGIKNDSLLFMQLNLRHFRRGRRRSGAVVAHTGYSPHQQDPHEVHRNILPHANALCHFHIAASINPATGRNCTKCLLQGNYNFLLACFVSISVTCSVLYNISLMMQNCLAYWFLWTTGRTYINSNEICWRSFFSVVMAFIFCHVTGLSYSVCDMSYRFNGNCTGCTKCIAGCILIKQNIPDFFKWLSNMKSGNGITIISSFCSFSEPNKKHFNLVFHKL